jgi:hypothetical protein
MVWWQVQLGREMLHFEAPVADKVPMKWMPLI